MRPEVARCCRPGDVGRASCQNPKDCSDRIDGFPHMDPYPVAALDSEPTEFVLELVRKGGQRPVGYPSLVGLYNGYMIRSGLGRAIQ